MRVLGSRLLEGCSAGLYEPTAIIDIEYSGQAAIDARTESHIRTAVAGLCPEQPLFRVSEPDWPIAFLVEGAAIGDQCTLGHWVVALAIAMQRWCRHPVWHGRVVSVDRDRMQLAIPWYDRSVTATTIELAVDLVAESMLATPDLEKVRALTDRFRDGLPTAKALGLLPHAFRYVQTAIERDIPFEILPSCVQLGWGSLAERMDSTKTGRLSLIATVTAENKFATNRTLAAAGLPIPAGELVTEFSAAGTVATRLGWPVVIKPVAQDRGVGVISGICDFDALQRAFAEAHRLGGGQVIIEKHVEGDDFRLLVVRGRMIAATRRIPGGVVGDGVHTIAELVERVNADPRRVTTADGLLKKLFVDDATVQYLSEQGFAVGSIPDAGVRVDVQRIANHGVGGTAEEMTDAVHTDNRLLAERAARLIGLDIAGVDFLTPDISRSWREIGGTICEVNAYPGILPHWLANPDRDIYGELLDQAFGRRSFRIPTAAVGGAGSAEVCAMLHRIWMAAGTVAGVSTSEMLKVGDDVVTTGAFFGRRGGRMLLTDPGVQAAVIQMTSEEILAHGHPCDRYDVAALIGPDDLGADGVKTREQGVALNAEVLQRARKAAVINADDPLCMVMRPQAGTERHILVTRDPASVAEHRSSGGEAVFTAVRDGVKSIVLAVGDDEIAGIQGDGMNAMFAAALAWANGIEPETIRSGLDAFTDSHRRAGTALRLEVSHQRLLPGFSAGLAERTALVEISVQGGTDHSGYHRIRAGASTLSPEQPLYGVSGSDWPQAFLIKNSSEESDSQLGEWVVALTIAMQRWARDPVWRGRVVRSAPDRLWLAIPWRRQALFTDALAMALRLIEQWARPAPDPAELQQLYGYLRNGLESAQAEGLAPNTMRFVQAAAEREIPFEVFVNWVQLGWGGAAVRMDSSFTGDTGLIATMMARNKFKSSRTLADAGLPLPSGSVVDSADRARAVVDDIGWPVVVKPLNTDQGVGVTPNIRDEWELQRAFNEASLISPGNVIVEKHFPGDDHRLLVVHGTMIAAARRTPGGVFGDGVRTIGQLVELLNAEPLRGENLRSLQRRLAFDAEALGCLSEQALLIESVPEAGRWIPLRRTANISTGGSAVDVTADVHPDNRRLAERATRIVGLDIAGVDFLTTDITRSWREVGGVICEINAQPGFRPHWLADPGRDINGEIIDIMFSGRSGRIPTAAITGTNGKTTTAMMLHCILSAAGLLTGVCTTAEVRIGSELASTENLSGYPGARIILNDPAVQAAVLEMPRKGLIVFGHACDRYDVAALLNIQNDHIGVDGVYSLAEMAELKAEVLQRATNAVVINADDPLCMAMRGRSGTDRHILVACDRVSVAEHRSGGGEAVYLAERDGQRWIVLASGERETGLMPVDEIPATMHGLLRFNESNAMFAAALAWAQGVESAVIRRALGTFANSTQHNPGRYNFIEGFPFTVLLDYAHNSDGVREVCSVADTMTVQGGRLVGLLTVGNLQPEHFIELAPRLAESFDRFVVGCVPEAIQRSGSYGGGDPVGTMLSRNRALLREAGAAEEAISTAADPAEAIRMTLSMAEPGDLVVLLAKHQQALPVIERMLAEKT